MVRQAAQTAESASISTPVRSTVRTVATTSTPPRRVRASTSTPESAIGWQRGTRSGVFLAAMMPARRAAAITSPFSDSPRRTMPTVAGAIATNPRATATRSVFSFAPTSIIFMWKPLSVRAFLVSRPGRVPPCRVTLPWGAPERSALRRLFAGEPLPGGVCWPASRCQADRGAPLLCSALLCVLAEPAFRVDGGDATRARGADGLTVGGIGDVTRGEDTGHAGGGGRRAHLEVADLVPLPVAPEQAGVGVAAEPPG